MRKGLIALACFTLFAAGDLAAQDKQVWIGPQLSWGDDADLGLGARIVGHLPDTRFAIIGSFDWFFPDDSGSVDVDYWEINGNVVYRFELRDSPSVHPYAGAGLNVAHASVSSEGLGSSDTELGLNLLGGSEFQAGALRPFVELRIEIEGGDQFVLTGGLLF